MMSTQKRLKVKPGESWKFTVRLKRPHGNANPHAFDYEVWLLERGIRATGYVRANPPQLLDEMVWSPAYLVERLRFSIRERLLAVLPAETYPLTGILVALAIGDQKSVNGDLWTTFNRTSTTHLFSVSGSHITLVAALLAGLVGWVWRRVPALALRLPAQRAALLAGCLMALGLCFSGRLWRTGPAHLVHVAGGGAGGWCRANSGAQPVPLSGLLVVLLIDPWAILAAGFGFHLGRLARCFMSVRRWLERVRGWRARLAAWGMLQWTATLASLPVLLLIFQQFSLVSPLANALAIPVISFIVTPLALLAALIPWWPILWLPHTILGWLMIFLEWCALLAGLANAGATVLERQCLRRLGSPFCLLPRGMVGRGLWAGHVAARCFLAGRTPGGRNGTNYGAGCRAGFGGGDPDPDAHVGLRSRPALQRRVGCRAARGGALFAGAWC